MGREQQRRCSLTKWAIVYNPCNAMTATIKETPAVSLVILNTALTPDAVNTLLLNLNAQTSGFVTVAGSPFSLQTVGGQMVAIDSERIGISMLADRVIIEKKAVSGEHDLVRWAEIAEFVIASIDVNFNVQPIGLPAPTPVPLENQTYTFGFNVQTICEIDVNPSQHYLANRFFQLDSLINSGFTNFRSNWDVQFVYGDRTWHMTVRPFSGAGPLNLLEVQLNLQFNNQHLFRDRNRIAEMMSTTMGSVETFLGAMEKQ